MSDVSRLKIEKTEQKTGPQQAEINVVSELMLEEVIQQLLNLPDETADPIRVTVTPVHEDLADFVMVYEREGKATAFAEGHLRRWADSMTHIVCDGSPRTDMGLIRGEAVLGVPGILIIVGGVLALMDIIFLLRLASLLLIVMAMTGPALLAGVLAILAVNTFAPDSIKLRRRRNNPYHKDRDRLLQLVADTVAPRQQSRQAAGQRLRAADDSADAVQEAFNRPQETVQRSS